MIEEKWPGDACPPDCIYSMAATSTTNKIQHRHCGYILKPGKGSRGCDCGPGCIRYDNGAAGTAPERPRLRWDVARGRQLWLLGWTHAAIANELGITKASVERRVAMYWKKGID